MTRPIRAATLFLVVACLAAGAVPAAADPLADKRREAERLARELDEQGRRISVLAEEVNAARIEAERLAAEANVARAELARTEQEVQAAQARLKRQAVDAYVRGGQLPAVDLILTGGQDDFAVRREYVRTVMGHERDALAALRVAQEERRNGRAALEAAEGQAKDALAAVEANRRAASAAEARQRAVLAQVQGELSALVEADRRRRAEEAARRAQEELARRQAQEEAERRRRASTTTTTRRSSSPTTAPGGSGPTSPPPPAPPPASGAQAAVEEARRQLGKPYEWGADGPDSFDCSGLTQWAWRAGGKSLPHSSRAQFTATSRVAITNLQPGDLVFYGDPIHHVGIFVGDGRMIEASETGTPVRYASIYRRDFAGAGRVG